MNSIKQEKARRSLHEFTKQAWHVIEPSTEFMDNWHIAAICDHLEAITRGEIRNLLINMPPRHMKSIAVAVMWPAWAWIDHPELKWLFASYSLQLSIRDNRKCRQLIESDWYQERWGDSFSLSEDQNVKSRFENNAMGYRMAVSTSSAATGEGGDIIVVDDPHNVIDADSDNVRQNTLEWWNTSMATRLNDLKKGHKVVIGQRVHQNDLSGFLEETGEYVKLKLPAEYEPNDYVSGFGWEDPRTEEGELLWPQRMGPDEIKEMKMTMGSYDYAAQFQQRPSPAGGGNFKEIWFRYFKRVRVGEESYYKLDAGAEEESKMVPVKSCSRFMIMDLAASVSTRADYTVITCWDVTPDTDQLLLGLVRARLEGPDQMKVLWAAFQRWKPDWVGIETGGYQLTMVQTAVRAGLPVRELKAERDKISRSMTAAVRYEAGKVFHPAGRVWVRTVEDELLAFPTGTYDDIVDTVAYAAIHIAGPRKGRARIHTPRFIG